MDTKLDEIYALESWEKNQCFQKILAGILMNGLNNDYDESIKYAIEHDGFKNCKTFEEANLMVTRWEGHIKLANELRSVSISNKSIKVTNTNSITTTNTISDKRHPKPWMYCYVCDMKGDHFPTHCPEFSEEQRIRCRAARDKEIQKNNRSKPSV